MSRSVDYLNNADYIGYFDTGYIDDNDDYIWDFQQPIIDQLKDKFPSLEKPYSPNNMGKWDGRETEIILENSLVEIGTSEYCGLSSISFRLKDADYINLAKRFSIYLELFIDKNIMPHKKLIKLGTFSNGEGVYQHVQNTL